MIENASAIEVSGCTLDQVGGNGIFLSGDVSDSEVHHNEVRFSGDSSIAAVGKTVGGLMDGMNNQHPRRINIHHNHLVSLVRGQIPGKLPPVSRFPDTLSILSTASSILLLYTTPLSTLATSA
jgi:hypothetical protein